LDFIWHVNSTVRSQRNGMQLKTVHTLISLINVEPMLTNFEKFHPPRLSISEIFPPSTPRLLDLCTSFFQKFHPPRLFQAPLLAIWQLLHPLHVY